MSAWVGFQEEAARLAAANTALGERHLEVKAENAKLKEALRDAYFEIAYEQFHKGFVGHQDGRWWHGGLSDAEALYYDLPERLTAHQWPTKEEVLNAIPEVVEERLKRVTG
jgi:hypothetical protein